MSYSVNTNNNALAALQTLNLTQQALTKAQNRVSSGLKVAGAADDASTFAIAQGQRGDIAGFQQISGSLAIGSATVNVALQGAQSISDTLNSLKAKVIQGLSSSPASLASIQNDINSFISQINSTAAAAQFNGVNLINDAAAGTTTAANDKVLSSLNRAGTVLTAASITVASQNLTSASLGIAGINIADAAATLSLGSTYAPATGQTVSFTSGGSTTTFEFVTSLSTALSAAGNVPVVLGATNGETTANLTAALGKDGYNASFDNTGNLIITSGAGSITSPTTNATGVTAIAGTTSNATTALATVEAAITAVQASLSTLGTASTQLATQTNFISTLTNTLTTGVGQLVDADLAAESANLQALQTKQSLGIQALSIANQGPGAILTLFR
jgi:flagellin